MVYHAIQDAKDVASPEELAAMEKEMEVLRDCISTARVEEKILRANLVTLHATMSLQDLRAAVGTLDMEKRELLKRLAPLRLGNVKPVSSMEKTEVDQAWKLWSNNARVRKTICMNVWGYITEELPEGKTKEDLWVG